MSACAEFYGQEWRTCGPPAISLHLNKLSIGFRELLSLLGWRRLLILGCGSPSWSPARSVLPHPARSVSARDTRCPKMRIARLKRSPALSDERPWLVSTVTSSSRHQKTPKCPKDIVGLLFLLRGNAKKLKSHSFLWFCGGPEWTKVLLFSLIDFL